jgi:dihydropyrimidine dehydrogenase (NAD+) subunit PreA
MSKNIEVEFLGKVLENPFVLASAPPTRDYESLTEGFNAGWAGAITKSVVLEPLVDKTPRIGHIKTRGRVIATQNYEMGSEYPIDVWVGWATKLKEEFPEKMIYASIFGTANTDDWVRLSEPFLDTGIDGLELNFSCPHSGHNGKGSVIGAEPELCAVLTKAVKKTVGCKMKIMPKLPYISHPNEGLVARSCIDAGADAIAGINTIAGLCEIDPYTLRPKLQTGGMTTAGGISYESIRPFGRLFVSQVAKNIDWKKNPISATGGVCKDIESIVEYIALGSNHLQVCTEVMNNGYGSIKEMIQNLESYLDGSGRTLEDVRGATLEYITSWDKLESTKKIAKISPGDCTECYKCEPYCMYNAINIETGKPPVVTKDCTGCGSCYSACPKGAISMISLKE